MSEERKHTPGPCHIDRRASTAVIGSDGLCVAACGSASRDFSINQANADFIVRAWNSHDNMLAALKGVLHELTDETGECFEPSDENIVKNAKAAIAKAEGCAE